MLSYTTQLDAELTGALWVMLVPNIFLVVGMAILTLAIVHTLKCTFSGSEWDDPMILRDEVSTSRMVVNKDTHEHTYFLVSMILSVIQILSVLLITCASGLSLINIYRDAGVDCGLRRSLACGHALALLGTGGAFAFAVYGVVCTNHGHPVLSDFEGARRDFCGVCAGENNTCAACDGAVAGATVVTTAACVRATAPCAATPCHRCRSAVPAPRAPSACGTARGATAASACYC